MFTVVARILLGLSLALAAAPPSCSLAGDREPRPACVTDILRPTATIAKNGRAAILVRAHAICDRVPAHHVITISLQRRYGQGVDDWGPVSDFVGNSWRSCADIPTPGHDVTCDWLVQPCVDGTYRAGLLIQGDGDNGAGQIVQFGDSRASDPAAIRCR